MNKGMHVNAEKLYNFVDKILPYCTGAAGTEFLNQPVIRKTDVLEIIESLIEIKDK